MKKTFSVKFYCLLILTAIAILSLFVFIASEVSGAEFLKKGLEHTEYIIDKPKIFGGFHLSMLGICIALAIALVIMSKRIKRMEGTRLDGVVFAAGIVLLLLELYKQLFYHYVIGNGSYNFGILPLQFCSYDLYFFLIIPFLKEGKIKDSFYLFTSLYGTMGGCIVMAYPVLYSQLSLSLHTMIWHTVMISMGILIFIVRGYGRRYFSEMLPPTVIFLCTVGVAVILNFLLTPLSGASLQPLNLFYISPYVNSTYIIIGDIQRIFGWIPSVISYILLFILLGANIVWAFAKILFLITNSQR